MARIRSCRSWLNIAPRLAALAFDLAPGLAQPGVAPTGGYTRLATIGVPGGPLTAVDFSLVDPLLPLYYTTDRSNAGIDVSGALHNRFLVRITGNAKVGEFAGAKSDVNVSRSNAVAVPELDVLWASDGDSTIKVIDLFTYTVTKSISTGGT